VCVCVGGCVCGCRWVDVCVCMCVCVCATEHFNNINMLGYLCEVTAILIHL